MNSELETLYTFDDVILKPQRSPILSRSEVDLSIDLGLLNLEKLGHPLISSNMDTITELEMAEAMGKSGGIGILHRYTTKETILKWIKELLKLKFPAIPSIGIKDEDLKNASEYEQNGATMICVDVAHADQVQVYEFIDKLALSTEIPIIAGNITDGRAAYDLYNCGVDIVRVGIGNGSLCTTRVMTGHGVPQLSALLEVSKYRRLYNASYLIISDGGVKTPGDCVKALAAGADMVMSGFIFAGCEETPNFPSSHFVNKHEKRYRGMASFEAQMNFRGRVNNNTPEGEAMTVKNKGPVQKTIDYFLGGIRSGLSYSGAKTIEDFQNKAKFILVTNNGYKEGLPNALQTL